MPSSRSGSHSLTEMTGGRETLHVFFGGEERPGFGVLRFEGVKAVGVGVGVVVQVEQESVVFDGGREVVAGPGAGDVGAECVEAADQVGAALTGETESEGEGEVAAAAGSGDDDAGRIDAESQGVVVEPAQAGDAVVEAAGVRREVGRGGGYEGVAEVDHCDGDAVAGDEAAPGAGARVVARAGLHAAAVDVVDGRQRGVGLGADQQDVDRVAVGLGGDGFGADVEAVGGGELFEFGGVEGGEGASRARIASGLFIRSISSSRFETSGWEMAGRSPNMALRRGSMRGSSAILFMGRSCSRG